MCRRRRRGVGELLRQLGRGAGALSFHINFKQIIVIPSALVSKLFNIYKYRTILPFHINFHNDICCVIVLAQLQNTQTLQNTKTHR